VLIEAGLARPVLILLLGVAAERTRYRRVSIRPWERGHLSTSTANVRASSLRVPEILTTPLPEILATPLPEILATPA
jgi:hypothetical protein